MEGRNFTETMLHDPVKTAIEELCFKPSGFLFDELETFFSEVFGKRNELYLKMLKFLTVEKLLPQELAQKVDHPLNGDWTTHISNLELAGFIRRDYTWNFENVPSKLSKLRLIDNYTKFYLKYILPQKNRLKKLPVKSQGALPIPWSTVFGLQFENLILNNLHDLIEIARIPQTEIVQLGPYFQSSTKARPGVQIDCLVQCKKGILHVFEFKTGNVIGASVENEVQRKLKDLKIPRGFAVRCYLVYLGELSDEVEVSDFFDRKIAFCEFIKLQN